MLKFYGLEFTTKDHPGLFSLVLYTNKCNFRCFGCHNRVLAGWDYIPSNKGSPKIVNINTEKYHKELSKEEIEIALKSDFLDMIILCGGETLIHNIKDIINTIKWIKKINSKLLIRIDTNGSFPEKVRILKKSNIVDGFVIDIKGPYWNQEFYSDISKIIGLPEKSLITITKKLLESIYEADDMSYSIFRTLMYPIIKNKSYFDEIKKFTNNKLKSPHSFNIFQET